jgi:hypothetical protein
MTNWPDPRTPPNKLDRLALGPDCCRHSLITGCIIAQNGVPAGIQARAYLFSLRNATIHEIPGREVDMSHAEYVEWMQKLDAWEKSGGVVKLPPRAVSADHPYSPPPPAPTTHTTTPAEVAALAHMKERRQATADAIEATRHPKPTTKRKGKK